MTTCWRSPTSTCSRSRESRRSLAAVSSNASQSRVCPPVDDDDLEQGAERGSMWRRGGGRTGGTNAAEHQQRRDLNVLEGRRRRTPSRRTRRPRRTGSSGSASDRRSDFGEMRRAVPRRRARAARNAAGSRRNADRSARRRRRTTRSARRVSADGEATSPGETIAGSRRTSFSTSSGSRAAISNASRPPKECPIRTPRAPTGSTDGVDVGADVPGRLPWRVAVPEQVGREDMMAGQIARRARAKCRRAR